MVTRIPIACNFTILVEPVKLTLVSSHSKSINARLLLNRLNELFWECFPMKIKPAVQLLSKPPRSDFTLYSPSKHTSGRKVLNHNFDKTSKKDLKLNTPATSCWSTPHHQ